MSQCLFVRINIHWNLIKIGHIGKHLFRVIRGISCHDHKICLVTTGELNKSIDGDSQDIEAMIADLKKQLANGKLKDESQIKDAIKEAAKDYDLKLSDDDIAKLTSLLMKIGRAHV